MKKLLLLSLALALGCCSDSPRNSKPAFQDTTGTTTLDPADMPDPEELIEGVLIYPGLFSKGFANAYIIPLAEEFPCSYDVLIFPANMLGYHGLSWWDEEEERMVIIISIYSTETLDTLCHEWAHILTHDVPETSHGPAWGVVYAACYTFLID